MHSFLEMYKNSDSLHHAYYFIGHEVEDAVLKLKNFLEKNLRFNVSGNPDFYHRKFDTFSIDHAREISQSESRKDFSGNRKVFIIETDFITEEAQNALLKVFEEPTVGTHFFIFSPQEVLLPTLKSRMQIFLSDIENDFVSERISDLSLKERMNLIKEIVDGIKDEENTKQDAINLLNKIESELYSKGVLKNADKLKICEKTRASLYDRGAPVKMILENLVLSL